MTNLILDVILLLSLGVYFVVSYLADKKTENLLGHLIVVVSYHSSLLQKAEPNYGKAESLLGEVDNG